MAIQETIAALTGAPAIGPKVQVYQRKINFADQAPLASGAHFEFIELEAGDVVIGGSMEVVSAGTATAKIAVGVDGGADLLTATLIDAEAVTPFTATKGVAVGADTVDIAASVAACEAGIVMVTLVVMKGGDFAG